LQTFKKKSARTRAHPAIESYLRKWHADLFPELLAVVSLNSVDE